MSPKIGTVRSGSGVPRSLPRKRSPFSYGCRVDQKHLPDFSNTLET